MVPLLRILLIHLWVACVAGAVMTAGLAMGEINIWTFVWAGVIGLVIGVPAGMVNWAWLRPNRARTIGWTREIVDRFWRRRARPGPPVGATSTGGSADTARAKRRLP
ncbi:hypothetical protein [Pontibaca methylaminivorans]|uniref:hypothetical protein n=1 Tax=Pontibaca methylaminivorans TaxID=515897 RepID=UPI002FDB6533